METEIRTFIENDYLTLISWIDNEELNFQWGGPCFTFPLDLDQLRSHYKNSKVHPFILTVSSQPIGYVELVSQILGFGSVEFTFMMDFVVKVWQRKC